MLVSREWNVADTAAAKVKDKLDFWGLYRFLDEKEGNCMDSLLFYCRVAIGMPGKLYSKLSEITTKAAQYPIAQGLCSFLEVFKRRTIHANTDRRIKMPRIKCGDFGRKERQANICPLLAQLGQAAWRCM